VISERLISWQFICTWSTDILSVPSAILSGGPAFRVGKERRS
jgi:hypothetical protein